MTSLSQVVRRHPPREKQVSKAVKQLFESCGGLVYETPQGYRITNASQRRSAGIPDLWIFLRGGAGIWWEVKRPGGKRSMKQLLFASRCQTRGIQCHWGGVEEAKAYLRDLGLIA